MLRQKILERLHEINQLHLGAHLDDLSDQELEQFFNQLSPELLKNQQARLRQTQVPTPLEPVLDAETASDQWLPLGTETLSQDRVACLILAGGQGSRLRSTLPKALISVSPNGDKTLLQLHLEKITAATAIHRAFIPCAILTSPGNHDVIAAYLKKNHFFGLDPRSLSLITQNEAPFMSEQGNWILREKGKLASGPDGNGHALHLLKSHGVLNQWKSKGIEMMTIVPIDNPLADPVDPILIGYHTSHPADVTLKVIRRLNMEEKVGLIVRKENRILIQEYSELPSDQSFSSCLAHIGLFALPLSFAQQVSQRDFPWHLAYKQDVVTGQWIWKFERFIFDMLPYSSKTNLLLYPREDVYAPLKNASGDKSIATVQEALRRILSR